MQSGLYLLSIIIWLINVSGAPTHQTVSTVQVSWFNSPGSLLLISQGSEFTLESQVLSYRYTNWSGPQSMTQINSQKINSLVRRWLERIYHLPGRLWVAWFNGRCVASRRCLDTLSTELYQSAPVGFVSLPPCHCVPTWAPNCYRFYL